MAMVWVVGGSTWILQQEFVTVVVLLDAFCLRDVDCLSRQQTLDSDALRCKDAVKTR